MPKTLDLQVLVLFLCAIAISTVVAGKPATCSSDGKGNKHCRGLDVGESRSGSMYMQIPHSEKEASALEEKTKAQAVSHENECSCAPKQLMALLGGNASEENSQGQASEPSCELFCLDHGCPCLIKWTERCQLGSCSACPECFGETPSPTASATPAPTIPTVVTQPTPQPTPKPTPAPTQAAGCGGKWVLGYSDQTKRQACGAVGMVCSPQEEIDHNYEVDTNNKLKALAASLGSDCPAFMTGGSSGLIEGKELPKMGEYNMNGWKKMCTAPTSPRSSSSTLSPGCDTAFPSSANVKNQRTFAYCCPRR